MVFDPDLLDRIEELPSARWEGTVYRYVFGKRRPQIPNTRGARWNPPETLAVYTACQKATLLAELDHILSKQPVRPSASPSLYTLSVHLASVVDLSSGESLQALGLTEDALASDDFEKCQDIGGAVAWLGNDGLLVPSVRHADGVNLVVFTANHPADAELDILEEETLASFQTDIVRGARSDGGD